MTTVTFTQKAGRLVGVKAEGHANSDTLGRDLICNSISIATQFVAIAAVNQLKLQDTVKLNPDGFISIDLSDEEAEQLELLMNTLYEFMTILSNNNDEYIEVLKDEID